ncbi:MAG: glycoside hydrolase family 31 protein [Bacteroidales bacterium]
MKKKLSGTLLAFFLLVMLFYQPAMAQVKSFTKEVDGITCKCENGLLKIKICKDDLVEVKFTSLANFPEKQSLVIVNNWKQAVKFNVKESASDIQISTRVLKIVLNKKNNQVIFQDLSGNPILAEDDSNAKQVIPSTVAGIKTNTCTTVFKSPANEALYGLGCHPEDTLSINYKERDQDMTIKYMTGAIPVLLSTKGYGLLWDNYSASKFYGTLENNSKFKYESESGTMVDYYFFYGPSFDRIIALYREATGQSPMFPKWVFGLFQSQDRYKSQDEVLSVKDNYRNGKFPVDCIVQDWFYWEPDVIGSHWLYPTRYPNPKFMVDELHKANIHAMISIWPVFAAGTNNFKELEKNGALTTIKWDNVMTHTFDNYYDAHSIKARDLYWKQAYDSLIGKHGWDAWWVDQCEPDNGALLDERRKADFATGKGIDYFNTYSLMHSVGLYEHWRKDVPGKRAFFLIRQAFAGQQRNAATLWSSDITCTFRAFKSQVPQGINACASGIPYWTSDIGGYHFNWSPPDWSTPANRELFTRWFQFGTFSPIMRIHGKGERALFSKNWDEPTRAILLKYDNLRYRLLPYIYSLAWKVTTEGYTLMRSLAFDFPQDEAIYNIPDQYMFGPAFLVNPVTDQWYSLGNQSVKTRKVYLPKGADWIDFWTGKKYTGGQTLDALSPIETIPLYVKSGSIVPMGPFLQFATEKPADPMEIRIYPGANASFTLYEDENDNYNYEKGKYATIRFEWDEAARKLTISDLKGEYQGMVKDREMRIVFPAENHGIGVEFCSSPEKIIVYKGKKMEMKF